METRVASNFCRFVSRELGTRDSMALSLPSMLRIVASVGNDCTLAFNPPNSCCKRGRESRALCTLGSRLMETGKPPAPEVLRLDNRYTMATNAKTNNKPNTYSVPVIYVPLLNLLHCTQAGTRKYLQSVHDPSFATAGTDRHLGGARDPAVECRYSGRYRRHD